MYRAIQSLHSTGKWVKESTVSETLKNQLREKHVEKHLAIVPLIQLFMGLFLS
jgi:hypothetical protein